MPTAGRFLLDRNIVIALFEGDRRVLEFCKETERIIVPSIVAGELYFGALSSSRQAVNVQRLNSFLADRHIAICDGATAQFYGEVKAALRKKGRPLPDNDIWIAAQTIQHSGIIVSRDRHFLEVEGLPVEALT